MDGVDAISIRRVRADGLLELELADLVVHEGRVLTVGTLESGRHGIEDETHSCSVVEVLLIGVAVHSPRHAVCDETKLEGQVVDGAADTSFGHESLHRISALDLHELRVQEVAALLDFGFPRGMSCCGVCAVVGRDLFLAPPHPDALLLELAFVVKVLVRDALARQACEDHARDVLRCGSEMNA